MRACVSVCVCVCVCVWAHGQAGDDSTTSGQRGFHGVCEEQVLKTRKKEAEGALDATRGVRGHCNSEWRAICDRHSSCSPLLSP